jgi:hypothetical protein
MLTRIVCHTLLGALLAGLVSACGALDRCEAGERAVLAEFAQYNNVAVSPIFNPNNDTCFLMFTTTDAPEQVMAYYVEQLEAHGWQGVPLFLNQANGLSLVAHRDHFAFGMTISWGPNVAVFNKPLEPGVHLVAIDYSELSAEQVRGYEPNAEVARIEMDAQTLAKFAGQYAYEGTVGVVIELVGDTLTISSPGQLPIELIPVSPTRFRMKDFSEDFFVEFRLTDDEAANEAGGEVESMLLGQTTAGFVVIGGGIHQEMEMLPVR